MEKGQGHLQTMFGLELARQAGMDWSPSQRICERGYQRRICRHVQSVRDSGAQHSKSECGRQRIRDRGRRLLVERKQILPHGKTKERRLDGLHLQVSRRRRCDRRLPTTLSDYMSSVENAIGNNNNPERFIDFTSFARWILAHDLLASADAVGDKHLLHQKHDFDRCRRNSVASESFRPTVGLRCHIQGSVRRMEPATHKQSDLLSATVQERRLLQRHTPPSTTNSRKHSQATCKKALDEYQSVNSEAFDKSEKLHQRLISYDAARTFAAQKGRTTATPQQPHSYGWQTHQKRHAADWHKHTPHHNSHKKQPVRHDGTQPTNIRPDSTATWHLHRARSRRKDKKDMPITRKPDGLQAKRL